VLCSSNLQQLIDCPYSALLPSIPDLPINSLGTVSGCLVPHCGAAGICGAGVLYIVVYGSIRNYHLLIFILTVICCFSVFYYGSRYAQPSSLSGSDHFSLNSPSLFIYTDSSLIPSTIPGIPISEGLINS
jgi:hypothetical protein